MSEEVKVKCGHCKHRLPRKICGCPEGPKYNQQIEMGESCEFFLHNPAQPMYSEALAMLVFAEADDEQLTKAIETLDRAIELGLPEDDEIWARFTSAQHKSERAYRQSPENAGNSSEFLGGLQQMEKAVITDARGEYGIFSEPIYKMQLSSLAAGYGMVKDSIRHNKGVEQATAYLEEKLHLFDYLSIPPLLLLLALGELYEDKRDIESARRTFRRILEAPVNRVDDENEGDIREAARQKLQTLDSPDRKQSGCFIATAVYGGRDTIELEVLQQFRDDFLLRYRLGRLFVNLYYLLSPPCAKLVGKSRLTKKLTEKLLLRPIVAIIQRTCRNSRGYDLKKEP
jgi:tetratricopeptide (TPR) repeat protein